MSVDDKGADTHDKGKGDADEGDDNEVELEADTEEERLGCIRDVGSDQIGSERI